MLVLIFLTLTLAAVLTTEGLFHYMDPFPNKDEAYTYGLMGLLGIGFLLAAGACLATAVAL